MEVSPDVPIVVEQFSASKRSIAWQNADSHWILRNKQILPASLAQSSSIISDVVRTQKGTGSSGHSVQVRAKVLIGNQGHYSLQFQPDTYPPKITLGEFYTLGLSRAITSF